MRHGKHGTALWVVRSLIGLCRRYKSGAKEICYPDAAP